MSVGSPNLLAQLVMVGFIPAVVVLFLLFPPSKAAALGLVGGFLLLPNISFEFSGIPDYNKTAAMTMGVLVAGLAVEPGRILRYRPRLIDVPVFLMSVSPALSALSNGLGTWDALSKFFDFFVRWGTPWMLGRIFFADLAAHVTLATTMVGGAFLYAPLCWFEMKASPILHERVYGVKLLSVKHAFRGFFWRPNVFIEHGLMCALFLSIATVLAYTLWSTKVRRSLFGLPMFAIFVVLFLTTVGASSSMALALLFLGIGILVIGKRVHVALPLLGLVLLPPLYVTTRQFAGWSGREAVNVAADVFGPERAYSIYYRLSNERILTRRASRKPWLGYGEERAFTGNENIDRSDPAHAGFYLTVDSMWMWYMGLQGAFGLYLLYAVVLLAPWLAWRYVPPRVWSHPSVAITVTLALALALYAQDTLLNSFENQLYTVAGGGVVGLLGVRAKRRAIGL